MFEKELMRFAKQWREGEKGSIRAKVDPSTIKGYQEYMRMKYEMLCERLNEFNVNK